MIQFWTNILALVSGPVLAVLIQNHIEKGRRIRDDRQWILRTLLTTRKRSGTVSPEHVVALNLIEVVFAGSDQESEAVRSAWRVYFDHLTMNLPDPSDSNQMMPWRQRTDELLSSLVSTISKSLGYKLDSTHLKNSHYFPQANIDREAFDREYQMRLLAFLQGKQPLPIEVLPWPQPEPNSGVPNSATIDAETKAKSGSNEPEKKEADKRKGKKSVK